MHTAAAITADALRINIADLDAVIEKIRGIHADDRAAPKASARYVAYLRRCHDLREKGIALGAIGPLFDELTPTPINDQLVGITAEQRKEREWKGVFARFPFPVAAPFQFLEAAE